MAVFVAVCLRQEMLETKSSDRKHAVIDERD
jgi:hypothetical protein